jgi:lysophospholipid acyltransferase (LPLAT)-like uncharacterized protein
MEASGAGQGPDWERSSAKRLQVALIAAFGTPIIRLLAWTWRWRVEGEDRRLEAERAGGHGIYALWHGRILPGIIHLRGRRVVVIISENFDGEWIARIVRRLGYGTARGSSSRGARKALLQLVREAKAHPTAFTVDGPRGPARVAQPGAVWLSQATGHPVVPFHAEASSSWELGSWDRTQIPKPFATVAFVIGEPFVVSREAGPDAIEAARIRLERELAQCEQRCRDLVSR